MNTEVPPPIPMPLGRRLRGARLRLLPVLVFAGAAAATALLWKDHVAALTMVGQAEPIVSNVSCHRTGVLAELNVNRFQHVKFGEPMGRVMIVDPRILAASLAVIQSEIEALRVNLRPVAAVQRLAMDYDQLRLEWMRQRTLLAADRVNLQLAEVEFHRMEELFTNNPPIISARDYDKAKATRDGFQTKVAELSNLVSACEKSLHDLQVTNRADLSVVSTNPLVAAIAVQESKLRLTEAEMNPVVVKAPMDGIITTIYHRVGEAVTPGESIVALATLDAVRIVGYLRPPIVREPQVGMKVTVRTRGLRRNAGPARILEVGSQFEPIPPTLLGPVNFANVIQGLPVNISLPANLKIRPGELVDIILLNKAD